MYDKESMSDQQGEDTALNECCWKNWLAIWKKIHELLTSHYTYTKWIIRGLIS